MGWRCDNESYQKRFWSKAKVVGTCWIWKAGKNSDGYGVFSYKSKSVRAHRMAWIFSYGPIPDSMLVLHRCDNPSCIRPTHLFLGTTQDNVDDRESKGRGVHLSGSLHYAHKLMLQQVQEIRRLGNLLSQNEIARMFSVSRGCISAILNNKSWKEGDK